MIGRIDRIFKSTFFYVLLEQDPVDTYRFLIATAAKILYSVGVAVYTLFGVIAHLFAFIYSLIVLSLLFVGRCLENILVAVIPRTAVQIKFIAIFVFSFVARLSQFEYAPSTILDIQTVHRCITDARIEYKARKVQYFAKSMRRPVAVDSALSVALIKNSPIMIVSILYCYAVLTALIALRLLFMTVGLTLVVLLGLSFLPALALLQAALLLLKHITHKCTRALYRF